MKYLDLMSHIQHVHGGLGNLKDEERHKTFIHGMDVAVAVAVGELFGHCFPAEDDEQLTHPVKREIYNTVKSEPGLVGKADQSQVGGTIVRCSANFNLSGGRQIKIERMEQSAANPTITVEDSDAEAEEGIAVVGGGRCSALCDEGIIGNSDQLTSSPMDLSSPGVPSCGGGQQCQSLPSLSRDDRPEDTQLPPLNDGEKEFSSSG